MSDVEVQVGDVIDVAISGKVIRKGWDGGRRVVRLDTGANLSLDTPGLTVKVKPLPKPAVGEPFDGDRLLRTRWKRSTIIEATSRYGGVTARYVLAGSGDWIEIDSGLSYDFERVARAYGSFKVLTVG